MANHNQGPTLPRSGKSSVTPEQAHINRERRREIKHGKGQKKKRKGK